MTELQSQWIKTMLQPDVILSAGVSLMIIGGVFYGMGRSAFGKLAIMMRETLMQSRKGYDTPKQERLQAETASLRRLPSVGMNLVVIGALLVLIAIAMFFVE